MACPKNSAGYWVEDVDIFAVIRPRRLSATRAVRWVATNPVDDRLPVWRTAAYDFIGPQLLPEAMWMLPDGTLTPRGE